MDELLPPEPPGIEKKQGFFKKLFGGRKEERSGSSQVIVQQGNLQQIATQMPAPSRLEQIPVSEEVDLNKLRNQLGLTSVLEQQAPPTLGKSTSASPARPALQDRLQDMKPRYTLDEMPSIPEFKSNVQEYNKSDFTRDTQSSAKKAQVAPDLIPDYNTLRTAKWPANPQETETDAVEEPIKSDFNWTKELVGEPKKIQKQEEPKQQIAKPREIIKEPEKKKQTLKSLEPEAIDAFVKKKIVKTVAQQVDWATPESELEQELAPIPEDKIDFTSEPDPIPKSKIEEMPEIPEPGKISAVAPEIKPRKKSALDEPAPIEVDFSKEPVITKREPEPARGIADDDLQPGRLPHEPSAINLENAMKTQPVAKFANDMREKIRAEVEREERKRIMMELEEEKARLEMDKNSFEKQRKEFEEKLKLVEEKEAGIIKKVEEHSRLKAEIKEERERIKSEKEEHKAIKEKLPKLRKQHQDLAAKVTALQDRIELNQRIEENLTLREKTLKDAEEKLRGMEKTIKENGFSEFLDKEINEKEIAYPTYEVPKDRETDSHGELYQVVDSCRSLIWQKKLSDARQQYMKARDMYHEMLEAGDKSEELYMLIRELYDDLNLAILNN